MENNTNTTPENELNFKQVLSDEPVKPSERPVLPIQLPPVEDNAETLAFDKPTVLDERFAARKAAQPRRAVQSSPRPAQTPAKRRAAARSSGRLYSGETKSDAARRIFRECCVLILFVLLVSGGFWLKGVVVDFLSDDTYATLSKSSTYSDAVRCRDVPLESTALPDGYAAAQAVCTQLGRPITDSALFAKTEEEIIFASEVADCIKSTLPDHDVQMMDGLSNRDLLIRIHESLLADKPVIVLLAEPDAGSVRLQYAVVTGMCAEKDSVTVVNPNSGKIQYTMEEFIDATRFQTDQKMPFLAKLGLTFGSLSRNTAIFVE